MGIEQDETRLTVSVAGSTDALLQAAVPVARRETRYHLLSAAAGTEIAAPSTRL
jgi:hypothetical protein